MNKVMDMVRGLMKKSPSIPAQQHRAFNAARIDRLTASFLATTVSINQELRTDLDKIRARGRHIRKNNDLGKKFSKMVDINVVGPNGFKLYARSESSPNVQDKADNDAIEKAFSQWCRAGVCEITGRMSLTDVIRTTAIGMTSDGEFLVRMIRGRAARNAFNFAIQVIDVDRIDTNYNLAASSSQNAVRMGVEIDSVGRPVALHIFTAHPNDGANSSRMRERVPMEDLLHKYVVEDAEQYRGTPWLAPVVLTMHHLGEFEQSAMLAARKGADTLGFFVSPEGTAPTMDGKTADNEAIEVSVPGMYDTLPEGYDFKPYESKYPDAMMEQFTKSFLRRISSGLNVSYPSLASDPSGVNFSSLRAFAIEERDAWMALQTWFIEHLLTPIYESWLSMALLSGAIKLPSGSPLPASKLEKFRAHHWQGRRWQWVDPAKDIKASRDAVKSGVASPQMIAAQNGVDVEDVLEDIARFEQMAKTAGVTIVNYSDNDAPAAEPATPPNPDDE
jgi:lambda family phage portal protein